MHTGKLRELDSRRELAEFHLANIKLIFQLITLKRTLVLSWVLSSFKSLPSISLVAYPFLGIHFYTDVEPEPNILCSPFNQLPRFSL